MFSYSEMVRSNKGWFVKNSKIRAIVGFRAINKNRSGYSRKRDRKI